jgi:hypothetical protein
MCRRNALVYREDERLALFVLRDLIFAQQRDDDLGPPHLDLPNVGGDQLGGVDGRIGPDVVPS